MSKSSNKTPDKKPLYLNAGAIFAIVVLGVVLISVAVKHHNNGSGSNTSSQSHNTSSDTSKSSQSDSSVPSSTKPEASTNSSSSLQQQTAQKTTGPCASVLTLAQAQSVLSGVSASSGNGTSSTDANTTVITCTYSSGSSNAAIVAHLANNGVGQSTNDLQFGSERPSNAVSVSGFGQSAFWQPGTGLNILKNNDWYVVNYSKDGSSTQSDSEQLANAAGLQSQY